VTPVERMKKMKGVGGTEFAFVEELGYVIELEKEHWRNVENLVVG
jgi:hypothetical protein